MIIKQWIKAEDPSGENIDLMIINKLGFDPTVAAGPLMATLIDVCGITLFFEISRIVLAL